MLRGISATRRRCRLPDGGQPHLGFNGGFSRRFNWCGLVMCFRRRSWHQDPKSFKDLKVLSAERMRIDVALCGQILIMVRREEHLKNVLACVQASRQHF